MRIKNLNFQVLTSIHGVHCYLLPNATSSTPKGNRRDAHTSDMNGKQSKEQVVCDSFQFDACLRMEKNHFLSSVSGENHHQLLRRPTTNRRIVKYSLDERKKMLHI